MKYLLPLLCLVAEARTDYAPIAPFLERYCTECHNAEKQKGDLRLDQINKIDGALWNEIYEAFHYQDMPPEEADQPTAAERSEILPLLESIASDEQFTIGTGYRRLNRREYRNTVRDLLGFHDQSIYNPGANVFRDVVEEGFDTNAEELILSNELLMEYLNSAQNTLEVALSDTTPPTSKRTTYNLAKLSRTDSRFTSRSKQQATIRIGKRLSYPTGPQSEIEHAGYYKVSLTARGVDRDRYEHPMPPFDQPFRLGLGVTTGQEHSSQLSYHQQLETYEIPDNQDRTIESIVWLEKGFVPYFSYLNGSKKPAVIPRSLQRKKKVNISKNFSPPGIQVTAFSIEGPLDPEWPSQAYRTTFGSDKVLDLDSKINRQNMLTHFIRRAYRRPITSTEVTPYLQFLENHYSTSRDWHRSLLQTMAAIMASPEFLYIREETGELSPHELANRLSYFLWSTMPDEELFQLASTGQLMQRETYIAQLKRLLASPRSRAFKESFATQWLSLDQLGTMRPDTKNRQYGIYYSQNLEDAMRQETQLFFNHILEENLSINDFLDADYTFLNQGLANLYQISHEGDSTLTRVALPSDSVRGGLISQASIHAITSNGVETLPVTRGHWVLHELLGAAPPPPPAEVPALVPDLNGISTVRQQLVKHREDPACMSCHKTLDPPGLVLESFDIIGRHRTHYANGQEIDPSGSFLGTSFNDITGFKRILLQHNDDFAHHLVSQLAEYAKGRTLNRADQQLVDAIIKENQPTQYRFQSLLADLLMSDLIRNR